MGEPTGKEPTTEAKVAFGVGVVAGIAFAIQSLFKVAKASQATKKDGSQ